MLGVGCGLRMCPKGLWAEAWCDSLSAVAAAAALPPPPPPSFSQNPTSDDTTTGHPNP